MGEAFDKGFAFICEGDTEKYFYRSLLQFLCVKHEGYVFYDKEDFWGDTYIIEGRDRRIIVYMDSVGTITQMVHQSNWFNNVCATKHDSKMPWDVFLCYDTDSYEDNISKFQEGDWKRLRNSLKKRKNIQVFDMASCAEIEDVFLADLEGISTFLGLSFVLTESDVPSGRKGKVKLKALFRKFKAVYHEGGNSIYLIECLDKQKLIDSGILPLTIIEKSLIS